VCAEIMALMANGYKVRNLIFTAPALEFAVM
jgi:hypothetical protein